MNLINQTLDTSYKTKFTGKKLLERAGEFWFVVAVLGQWLFVYYVIANYGGHAINGEWEKWNDTIPHGFVPGEPMGNFAVFMHILLAVIIIIGGPLQLIPQVQKHAKKFHRWNGRIYILTSILISLDGIFMVWTRGAVGDLIQHISITFNAILIIVFSLLALKNAVKLNFKAHREWALRLFMVVNGVWFFRLMFPFWLMINGGPVGFDPETFSGPALTTIGFSTMIVPLTGLQLYFNAQKSKSNAFKYIASAIIITLTLLTAAGIFAGFNILWLPRL